LEAPMRRIPSLTKNTGKTVENSAIKRHRTYTSGLKCHNAQRYAIPWCMSIATHPADTARAVYRMDP
jgi:hypothetical protein